MVFTPAETLVAVLVPPRRFGGTDTPKSSSMSTRLCCRAAILIAALSPLAFASNAHAARALSFIIRIDGKDFLAGMGGDNGDAPPPIVWRRLASTELKPAPGVEIKADDGNPLQATLRGEIEIDVSYGGKANVRELHLVRENPTAAWTVDREDVERTAKEIGLSDATHTADPETKAAAGAAKSSEQSPLLWIGVGLAAALFVSGIMVTRMRQRMPPSRPVRPGGPIHDAEPADPPFASPE